MERWVKAERELGSLIYTNTDSLKSQTADQNKASPAQKGFSTLPWLPSIHEGDEIIPGKQHPLLGKAAVAATTHRQRTPRKPCKSSLTPSSK